jgi:hypothetical protein
VILDPDDDITELSREEFVWAETLKESKTRIIVRNRMSTFVEV